MQFLLVLFVLLAVASSGRAEAVQCESLFTPFSFEKSRIVQTNWFVTTRGLSEYQQILTNRFTIALAELDARHLWIDFGTGKGIAPEDYLASGAESKADVLGITYKYRRWFPKYRGPKLKIQKGVYFEELPPLPQYQLGSDLYGIFSYTKHVDLYFERALKPLEVGRQHFIFANFFRTVIVKKNGDRMDVASWLSEVSSLKVEHLKSGVLVITKMREDINIPRLRLIKTDGQLPPGRVFEEY